MKEQLKFRKVHDLAIVPKYESVGAVGFDLASVDEAFVIWPGERVAVGTGLCVELPDRVELQIRPRSGMALKNGVTVLNSPGTIDHDYRGEIKVILKNLGKERFEVQPGDRIAQGVLTPYVKLEDFNIQITHVLSQTERGENGFGSTGITAKEE